MSHGGRTRRSGLPGVSNLLQAVGSAFVTAGGTRAELMTNRLKTKVKGIQTR